MKRYSPFQKHLVFSAILGLFVSGSALWAAPPAKRAPAAAPSATARADEPVRSRFSRLGLGLSTISVGNASSAFSIWGDIDTKKSFQGLFAIGSTDPFQFGVGGALRFTVSGNQATGFHLGGGLNLGSIANPNAAATGSATAFYIVIQPLAGIHFSLPSLSNIQLSLDGGPSFQVVDGDFQLGIGGLSSALGLSVHYFF